MAQTRLEKLKAKQHKLEVQLKVETTREREKKRKADTRRKILFGAVAMNLMEKDGDFKAKFLKAAALFYEKPADRKLLGLS